MNIGVIGRARSGKDTAGAWLVDKRGYERVAFADPLREVALALDPIISVSVLGWDHGSYDTYRLSEHVIPDGWEKAKTEEPEIRRTLQHLGASIRAVDPDFWLRAALAKADEVNHRSARPVVITDVRYPNEADELRRRGWHLLYVDRPGIPHLDHESEGALTAEDGDYTIVNASSLSDYLRAVELFHRRVHDAEAARHYGRSHT
ncbi:hypothetical protein [Streptomyces sp. CB03911]|uniref:deoxynucleotide monophosphate kinase family protein n=1 Tax=Streptomyces sp. CB03911 TaxID=1804758 RepID=UPI00093EF8C1|nr:hypothetical protein [Streptomyces sp. CB03911]OKI19303.1 hypothetical protein A6A07_07315 [Streptomyces sp. CB03911]